MLNKEHERKQIQNQKWQLSSVAALGKIFVSFYMSEFEVTFSNHVGQSFSLYFGIW